MCTVLLPPGVNELQLQKYIYLDIFIYWSFRFTETSPTNYEGWNFNSGNYLFKTDTK